MCCEFRAGSEHYGLRSYKISENSSILEAIVSNPHQQVETRKRRCSKILYLSVGNLLRTRSPNTRHTPPAGDEGCKELWKMGNS